MGTQTERWQPLPLDEWQDTYATLHMYTQVLGKTRLAFAPMMNQWWQVPLYLAARGLTTSPIPYQGRTFKMELDFIAHQMEIRTSGGEERRVALGGPVRHFYPATMDALAALQIDVRIWTMPVEVPEIAQRLLCKSDPVLGLRVSQAALA